MKLCCCHFLFKFSFLKWDKQISSYTLNNFSMPSTSFCYSSKTQVEKGSPFSRQLVKLFCFSNTFDLNLIYLLFFAWTWVLFIIITWKNNGNIWYKIQECQVRLWIVFSYIHFCKFLCLFQFQMKSDLITQIWRFLNFLLVDTYALWWKLLDFCQDIMSTWNILYSRQFFNTWMLIQNSNQSLFLNSYFWIGFKTVLN